MGSISLIYCDAEELLTTLNNEVQSSKRIISVTVCEYVAKTFKFFTSSDDINGSMESDGNEYKANRYVIVSESE